MMFFVWYMDDALARNGEAMTPTNEFSCYHFFSSMNPIAPYRSAIYLKEESAPQTHYNVYFDNERWDIRPVGGRGGIQIQGAENVFQAIVIFLYAVKSFKNVGDVRKLLFVEPFPVSQSSSRSGKHPQII